MKLRSNLDACVSQLQSNFRCNPTNIQGKDFNFVGHVQKSIETPCNGLMNPAEVRNQLSNGYEIAVDG